MRRWLSVPAAVVNSPSAIHWLNRWESDRPQAPVEPAWSVVAALEQEPVAPDDLTASRGWQRLAPPVRALPRASKSNFPVLVIARRARRFFPAHGTRPPRPIDWATAVPVAKHLLRSSCRRGHAKQARVRTDQDRGCLSRPASSPVENRWRRKVQQSPAQNPRRWDWAPPAVAPPAAALAARVSRRLRARDASRRSLNARRDRARADAPCRRTCASLSRSEGHVADRPARGTIRWRKLCPSYLPLRCNNGGRSWQSPVLLR